MMGFAAAPWVPPASPSLERLGWEAADAAGAAPLRAWPEVRMAGIAFGGLPPFLAWQAFDGRHHVVLLQVREIGALLRQSRMEVLPEHWLEDLDLESLARPLAIHPDFPGGASVHVVSLQGRGRYRTRDFGDPAPQAVALILARLTGVPEWSDR